MTCRGYRHTTSSTDIQLFETKFHCAAQDGLEVIAISVFLPQPPECGDYRCEWLCMNYTVLYKIITILIIEERYFYKKQSWKTQMSIKKEQCSLCTGLSSRSLVGTWDCQARGSLLFLCVHMDDKSYKWCTIREGQWYLTATYSKAHGNVTTLSKCLVMFYLFS